MTTEYTKKPLTIDEQIELLEKRGMEIGDRNHAADFLQYCAYYRFCGYALAFEILLPDGTRTHKYKNGTKFSDVEAIYHFDGELRRLLFHYITLIEIDFRNTLCNESALFYKDAHWFMNSHAFIDRTQFGNLLELCIKEAGRSNELFIKNYYAKYDAPVLPPIWMLAELMSFAFWSKTYQNLSDPLLKKRIAAVQGVPPKYLVSWLQALTVLRNFCAHHARIWNRNFNQAPLLTSRIERRIIPGQHKKIATLFLVIEDMLHRVKREEDFKKDAIDLFAKYPMIQKNKMGLPNSVETFFI